MTDPDTDDDLLVTDREWLAIRLRHVVPRLIRRRHTRTYVRTRWWR
ncbi:hypothetical protein ABZ671_00660 [Micromonospora sp. NPDC006766]